MLKALLAAKTEASRVVISLRSWRARVSLPWAEARILMGLSVYFFCLLRRGQDDGGGAVGDRGAVQNPEGIGD